MEYRFTAPGPTDPLAAAGDDMAKVIGGLLAGVNQFALNTGNIPPTNFTYRFGGRVDDAGRFWFHVVLVTDDPRS